MTEESNTPNETGTSAPPRQVMPNISIVALPDGRIQCATNADFITFCSLMLDGWRAIMEQMIMAQAEKPSLILPDKRIQLVH